MTHADPVNWQLLSQMPLIASMIDTALDDTREYIATLTEARARPHVLDDATVDRSEQVHTEQMEFVGIYTQQISRWRTAQPSASQASELDRMASQNERLRALTAEALAVARELRNGTSERVLGMSDVERGLQALLHSRSKDRR